MNVAPPPSNSSLKIISPANGQKLKQGSTYTISWQSSGDFNFVVGNIVAPVPGEGGVGIFQAPATSSRYSWTVPTGFPPGMYKLGLAGSDQDFVNHNFASSSVSIYIIP